MTVSIVTQIISQNTEWTAGFVNVRLGTVQVAAGVTLKIDPGAVVGDGIIQVLGTLDAQGALFKNVNVDGGNDSSSARISIDNSIIDGGSFLQNGIGSVSLTNSTLRNVTGYATIWTPAVDPVPNSVISGNLFDGFGGFSIHTTGPNVLIDHNTFMNVSPPWNGDPSLGGAVIASWASLGNAQVTVEHNNFLDVGKPTLAIPTLAIDGTTLTATNNYFGTSDMAVVSSMVFDKSDDLRSPGAISNTSVLSDPDTTAPQIIAALDTSTNQPMVTAGLAYSGPVANLQREYISVTNDNLNVTTATPNWFVHSGSGDDAIAVNSGTNVLDGGSGSNFLTGATGADTFFVDDRVATSDIWSTVVGFHAGDAATIWGVTPQDFGLAWVDGQGAAGFTGLTLHATAAGKPTASLTLAGYGQADMTNGRLSVSFGTDPASGSAYMYVHGNS